MTTSVASLEALKMYESYWNFSHKPFSYRVEADRLYRSKAVQSALLRLRYCIENNAGAAMLLGASGVGKSSLIQLLKSEGASLSPFIHLAIPRLTSAEISRSIACEILGSDSVTDLTPDELLVQQHGRLQEYVQDGLHPVIVLDETHLMNNDTLNDVVLPLLNLAETDFSLQYTVILAGQPVLASHVARNSQLRNRIAVTATMSGMTRNETADYLDQQLKAVGCDRRIFSDEAVDAIVEISQGAPRLINRICDMALLVGYSDQASDISATDIQSLATEILPAAA